MHITIIRCYNRDAASQPAWPALRVPIIVSLQQRRGISTGLASSQSAHHCVVTTETRHLDRYVYSQLGKPQQTHSPGSKSTRSKARRAPRAAAEAPGRARVNALGRGGASCNERIRKKHQCAWVGGSAPADGIHVVHPRRRLDAVPLNGQAECRHAERFGQLDVLLIPAVSGPVTERSQALHGPRTSLCATSHASSRSSATPSTSGSPWTSMDRVIMNKFGCDYRGAVVYTPRPPRWRSSQHQPIQ